MAICLARDFDEHDAFFFLDVLRYEKDILQILVSLKIIFSNISDGFNMVWVIDLS